MSMRPDRELLALESYWQYARALTIASLTGHPAAYRLKAQLSTERCWEPPEINWFGLGGGQCELLPLFGPGIMRDTVRLLLTPMLTPTPVNVGERPRTLEGRNRPFSAPSCTSLNVPERRAAGSKTAGYRFDSCPTCRD
jgi:hypothetical protein